MGRSALIEIEPSQFSRLSRLGLMDEIRPCASSKPPVYIPPVLHLRLRLSGRYCPQRAYYFLLSRATASVVRAVFARLPKTKLAMLKRRLSGNWTLCDSTGGRYCSEVSGRHLICPSQLHGKQEFGSGWQGARSRLGEGIHTHENSPFPRTRSSQSSEAGVNVGLQFTPSAAFRWP